MGHSLAFVFNIQVPFNTYFCKFMQAPGLNVLTEMVIGFIYPVKPVANVTFKTYGTVSISQAIQFLGDFKIGHYMKIPPKSMFIVQVPKISVNVMRAHQVLIFQDIVSVL